MISFKRLKFWLQGRKGLQLADRIQLWKQTVFAVMHFGIHNLPLQEKQLKHIHVKTLQMFRQIIGNHAYYTHDTHTKVLTDHGIPEPLTFWIDLLISIRAHNQARADMLLPHDIVHDHPWEYIDHNITLMQNLLPQFRSTQIHQDPWASDDLTPYHCPHCHIICRGLPNLRRHLSFAHSHPNHRDCQVSVMMHSEDGLPTCRHCKHNVTPASHTRFPLFTLPFRTHIFRQLTCATSLLANASSMIFAVQTGRPLQPIVKPVPTLPSVVFSVISGMTECNPCTLTSRWTMNV